MIWQSIVFQNSDEQDYSPTLKAALKAVGYKTYDPFPGGLGSPLGKVARVRMFMSPVQDGWQRLMVAPQDELTDDIIIALTQTISTEMLWLQLQDDTEHSIIVLPAKNAELAALSPFLQPDYSIDTLQHQLTQPLTAQEASGVPVPEDIQQLAEERGVSDEQISKMMGKVSKRMFKKAAKRDADANLSEAQAALNNQSGVHWGSIAAQKLMTIMQHTLIPADFWRLPNWQMLTGAYQIARQQQRGYADLLTTDAATLQKVPNALDYQLLYFSRKQS